MTIAEQILRIKDNISSAYAKAEEKGATLPEVLNSDNLPSTIESITGGGSGDFLGIGNFKVVDGVAQPLGSYDISNTFKDITSIVDNGMSNACTNKKTLTGSVNFANLTSIGNSGLYNAFGSCSNISYANFPKLETMNYRGLMYAFNGCTNLKEVSFPSFINAGSYTNQFSNMLSGCSDVTVHFRADMESTLSTWPNVQTGFSGTNTTVLFDL